MYKCSECNEIHSQKEWNESTFGERLKYKDKYDVEIQECDNVEKEFYGPKYLFECPSCGESGCFEDGEIIKV